MNSRITRISASAGSGKTYRLTSNFNQLLKSLPQGSVFFDKNICGRELKKILAITFTNEAAREMRQRVIKALKEAFFQDQQKGISESRANNYLNVIFQDYSALNIRTIDSFLNLLVRASAFDLGLNPDFEASFDDRDAFKSFVEQLFVLSESNPAVTGLLKEAFRSGVETDSFKGFRANDKFEEELFRVLIQRINGLFDNLSSREEIAKKIAVLEDSLVPAAARLVEEIEKSGMSVDANFVKSLKKQAVSATAPPEKYIGKDLKENINKKSKIKIPPQGLVRAFDNWREMAKRYVKANVPVLKKAVRIRAFVEVAEKLKDLYLAEKGAEKKLSASLIPSLAANVLKDDKGVSSAICRIGTQLTHFLMDEFQDTNPEQWKALRRLVLEALSNGGSMTFVGDVKQSIYRFRGGDPDLFDQVLQDRELLAVCEAKPENETLDTNRRSFRKIVEHNNNFFVSLKSPEKSLEILKAIRGEKNFSETWERAAEKLAAIYKNVEQHVWEEKKEAGKVAFKIIEKESAREIDEEIKIQLINLLKKKISPERKWSDILILCRSNDDCNEMAKELIANDIPVITENSLLLKEHSLIAQSLGFLRFLANQEDDIALWSVLKGSILQNYRRWDGPTAEELTALAAKNRNSCLARIFKQNYPETWKRIFEPFFKTPMLISAYDYVKEWYNLLEVQQRFPEEQTFIRRFLEILHAMEDAGNASLFGILEQWETQGENEKVPMPENANAVSIMTYHKAKGLQQKIVILPKINFYPKISGKTIAIKIDDLVVPIVPKSGLTQREYDEDLARQVLEDINILYVGFTRASEELYYFYNRKPKDTRLSLCKGLDILLENVAAQSIDDLPDYVREEEKKTGSVGKEDYILPQADWQPMKWLPRLKIYRAHPTVQALTAAERGTFMHACLERINPHLEAEEAVETAFRQTLRQTHYPVSEAETESIKESLLWFANFPQARRWMLHGLKEQSILNEKGEIRRMDLLVSDGSNALILDYKTGMPEESHIKQLQEYIANLGSDNRHKGEISGLLVYLDLKKFRVVKKSCASELQDRPELCKSE